MKLHYGERKPTPLKDRPGHSRMLFIQEREYATIDGYRSAVKSLRRQMAKMGVRDYNLFANGQSENGVPRLYVARSFTPAEIEAAGYDPQTFYEPRPVNRPTWHPYSRPIGWGC